MAKYIKSKPCQVCKCVNYKLLTEEKFSTTMKCEGCGSEYMKISDSDQLKVKKLMEKRMETGELEDKMKKESKGREVSEDAKKKHTAFVKDILK